MGPDGPEEPGNRTSSSLEVAAAAPGAQERGGRWGREGGLEGRGGHAGCQFRTRTPFPPRKVKSSRHLAVGDSDVGCPRGEDV